MPKRKKKSKSDARGYGQVTTFRAPPALPPSIQANETETRSTDNTKTDLDKKNNKNNNKQTLPTDDSNPQPSDTKEENVVASRKRKIPPRISVPPLEAFCEKSTGTSSWMTLAFHEHLERIVERHTSPLEALPDKQTHWSMIPWVDESSSHIQKQQQSLLLVGSGEPTLIRQDRFLKRLAKLYDVLDQALHLPMDAMKEIVQTLVRHQIPVTVEHALDYYCYRTQTADLPPFFTQPVVYEARRKDSLPVVPLSSPEPTQMDKGVVSDEMPPAHTNDDLSTLPSSVPSSELETTTEASQSAPQDKPKQVQTTPQFDEDQKTPKDSPSNEAVSSENAPDPKTLGESAAETIEEEDDTPPLPPTPDELRLQEMEREFQELTLDVQDEASNYMRSKQEVKDIQKRHKALEKQVQGLQRKVAKAAAARAALVAQEQAKSEEEEEVGEGVGFDLFGARDDENDPDPESKLDKTADTKASETPPPTFDIELPKEAISSSWTGQTPLQILEERCRKLKFSKPSFQKTGLYSCKLTVQGLPQTQDDDDPKPRTVLEYEGLTVDRLTTIKHYLATKALYEMDSTLPLYNLLPPFFRELWLHWLKDVQDEKDAIELAEEEQRQTNIEQLLSLIPESADTLFEASNSQGIEASSSMLESSSNNDKRSPKRDTSSPKPAAQTDVSNTLKLAFERKVEKPRYQKILAQRRSLPIFDYKTKILDTVENNTVTVLHADTGAGKTTQCPQFLLESGLERGLGEHTSIICTQPRRVAAISVAERVSEEMDSRIGDQVGYQIRLEAKKSDRTRLLFCTTGVILRRLIEDPTLKGVSHIVVDEVHERQWQIDVLLVALRRLIAGPRKDLKVILMSATLDAQLFCSFFHNAPLVSVPGRTFPVSDYYLEDLIEATGHIIEEDSQYAIRNYYSREMASLHVTKRGGEQRREAVALESETSVDVSEDFPGYSISTRKSMDRVDETVINYELIEDVLHYLIVEPPQESLLRTPDGERLTNGGAALIFMPGIGEIRTLIDRLQSSKHFRDSRIFDIIPMHSALSSSEQRRAFITPRKVKWAIIVATNIAETSVTIPDAVCVIDSGRVREIRHDKRTLTEKLVTGWCSRASVKQRAGRAGRVQSGICLRLFSSKTIAKKMSASTEPELQRLPLEEVCLTILAGKLSTSGCLNFLMQTPQPPKSDAIQAALLSLRQVGAISLALGDKDLQIEELTPLGEQLSKFPVNCRLGKMLLWAVWMRCVNTVVTIVASLSASQSPFVSSLRDSQVARARQATFNHEYSDFLTYVNVYQAFLESGSSYSFCRQNYLSFAALKEISEARRHYLDLLRPYQQRGVDWNENDGNELCLQCVLAAGLSPQIARIERSPGGQKETLWYRPTLWGTSKSAAPEQQVTIQAPSVLSKLSRGSLPSLWIVFFEKFGVQHGNKGPSNKVSVRTVSFIHPAIISLVIGETFAVQHMERRLLIDGWMSFSMGAQSAVLLRSVRQLVARQTRLDTNESDSILLDFLQLLAMVGTQT